VDSVDETHFAWSLLEAADAFLDPGARSWLFAQLGAGEQRRVIGDLLVGFAFTETELPAALTALLWSWVNGFVGSEEESSLRDTVNRIRIASSPWTAKAGPKAQLVVRRRAHSLQTTLVLVPAAQIQAVGVVAVRDVI
jgi:hypothetical protein